MNEMRSPEEERALERLGDREGDPAGGAEGGGGADLDESFVAPERTDSPDLSKPEEDSAS